MLAGDTAGWMRVASARLGNDGRATSRGARRRRSGALASAFLLLVLCVPVEVRAQATSIRFDHISLGQGLSQSTVTSIFQDSRGFMWFGTQDGLNRFDGYDIAVYKHDAAAPGSLPHSYVRAVVEDGQGDLWIATEGGGVARWDRRSETFTAYHHDPEDPTSLGSEHTSSVVLDSTGALWVGTFDAGLSKLDPATGKFEHFRHDPSDPGSLGDDRVSALYFDRGGTLWVGTFSGLSRYDSSTASLIGHTQASAPADRVRAIYEDSEGLLWIGTYDGLFRLDRATGTFSSYRNNPADQTSLPDDRVRALLEDSAGGLWVGSWSGLSKFDRASESFDVYRHDPTNPGSLSDDQIMSIYQDRGGVLWIGTQGDGLNKWNPATATAFSHYKSTRQQPPGLSSDAIQAFSQDADGRLWIGTFGGGLNRLDRSTRTYTHYRADPDNPAALSDDQVMALAHEADGTLWIGTFGGGLNRLDSATGHFETFRHDPDDPASLSSNGIMSLLIDRSDDLWIGTFGGGLNRLDRATGSVTRYRHDPTDPTSLSNDRVTCLAQDALGQLWAGTERGGLNRLDPATGTFVRYRSDPDDPSRLGSDVIMSLYADAAGSLWIGTAGGGFARLDVSHDSSPGTAVFRSYTERDGLPNNVVFGIEADDEGNVWLGTVDGLARFDPRAETFKNYDVSDGLQSNEFNFGAHYRNSAGELFFGGFNGFNAFHPDAIRTNAHVPQLALTSFSILNRPAELPTAISEIDNIEISYRDYVFSLEVAAFDYTAPHKNLYRYKLEGLDDDWIELGSRRRLTFTNLDSRSYVLRVRGASNDGAWNEEGIVLGITVIPPPWRSWWANTLYVLLFGGAVAAVVNVQRDKLRRGEENRRQLAAHNEHLEERRIALARANEALEQEIIERGRTEQALKTSEERYQDLYDQAPDMFATVDVATGQVIECNETMADRLGYAKEDIIGSEISDLHLAGCIDRVQDAFEVLRADGSVSNAELELGCADDSRIDAVLNMSAIRDEAGEIVRSRLVWRDITARRKLEDQLRHAQKLQAIDGLAGGLAHEFNNLLTGIACYTDLALDDAGDGFAREAMENIQTCVDRASNLTRQLMAFTRREPLKTTIVDVNACIESATQLLGPTIGEQVEVKLSLHEDIGAVRADADRIEQMLINLAVNARDAMPDGGTMTITTAEVEIEDDDEIVPGRYVTLAVSDTGRGMDEATRERLFEPFFTTKEQGKGTGLGLAMVYGTVSHHAGHIQVDSRPGEGSTFRIYLPILKQQVAIQE